MEKLSLAKVLKLQGSTVVLMPTDASSRQCRDAIAKARSGHEHAFLETVAVMPLEQWFAELWDSTFPAQQVLRPVQVIALARDMIESSEHYPPMCLNPLAITRQFVDAYNTHIQYDLPEDREAYLFSPEYESFQAWSAQFKQLLTDQDAMTASELPLKLLELVREGAVSLPDNLVLSDYVEMPPAAKKLVDLAMESSQGFELASTEFDAAPQLAVVEQVSDECKLVASWLAEILPTLPELAHVGVLVPDVRAYRNPLKNALSRILYSDALFQSDDQTAMEPWIFEGTEKLLSFPLIHSAWDIISLTLSQQPIEQLSRILRSKFVKGWPEMRGTRASLDILWRDRLGMQASLRAVMSLSAKTIGEEPDALEFLVTLHSMLQTAPAKQLPSQWVRFYDQMLLAAGWPNIEDDLVVTQCLRGFSQTMDVFRALDRQLGEVSHGDALSWLQHILSTKRFSLSRDWHCPIRIMSYDDAVGINFDAVWVMGLDDSALPRRAEPSPFLPITLQQDAGIPESDPVLMLERDAKLLERILKSSPVLVSSYCKQTESGSPSSPSSLLGEALPLATEILPPAYTVEATITQPDTDLVSHIVAGDRSQLRGGTGLFKEYAASPWFAFLKYRLRLSEFPRSEEGLDHRIQGILLHDTLQYFWEQTCTKSNLDSMSPETLAVTVEQCVDRAFDNPEIYPARYGQTLLALEKARLMTLVLAWLNEKEKARTEDFEVVGTEEERELVFMGIPLKLRVDRIDDVGGHRLLIDYKSGRIDGKSLNASDLTEPQLPIYVLAEKAAGGVADGVMLASVRSPESLTLHMRSNWQNSVIKKRADKNHDVDTPEKFADQMQAWESALQEMATGILSGNIGHDSSRDHARGFSAYLLPLLRGAINETEGEDA